MTKTTLALAAALLAGTTLSTAANAGGVRLGFGFPLGSFVAHEHQNYSAAPSYERHCDKPVHTARHEYREDAPVRKVSRPAPKVEVADEEPAPLKVKAVKDPAPIQVAKLDDTTVKTDAAPSIYVPETPVSDIKGTQSTPTPFHTASITPEVVKDAAKVDEPKVEKTEKVEKVEKDEPKAKVVSSTEVKRLCRRFSAAIAGLIDVPCE
jgi:hypothetical protein